jgi:hypothetical protein
MKQVLTNWKQRLADLRENSLATKGRSETFQIVVTTVLITVLVYTTWYFFKILN